MSAFDKILELSKDENVQLAKSFKSMLGKELVLGMTDYVIEHGCLADGFEHLTDAQRYFQANREMHTRGCELANLEAAAMEAEADLLDAEETLLTATRRSDILRAEAKKKRALQSAANALTTYEDTKRQINKLQSLRMQLREGVFKQYPEGIEQAERDHWESVFKFRLVAGGNLSHVPLEKEYKARLALESGRPDAAMWLAISEPEKMKELMYPNLVQIPEGL